MGWLGRREVELRAAAGGGMDCWAGGRGAEERRGEGVSMTSVDGGVDVKGDECDRGEAGEGGLFRMRDKVMRIRCNTRWQHIVGLKQIPLSNRPALFPLS